jgi:hypothetical protein
MRAKVAEKGKKEKTYLVYHTLIAKKNQIWHQVVHFKKMSPTKVIFPIKHALKNR